MLLYYSKNFLIYKDCHHVKSHGCEIKECRVIPISRVCGISSSTRKCLHLEVAVNEIWIYHFYKNKILGAFS